MLVKGADWAEDAIVGRDIVEARGGRVVRVPIEAGHSTSALVEKITPMTEFRIERRLVGDNAPPLVIAEIGINHEGDVAKAIRDGRRCGARPGASA